MANRIIYEPFVFLRTSYKKLKHIVLIFVLYYNQTKDMIKTIFLFTFVYDTYKIFYKKCQLVFGGAGIILPKQ
jgi:hypothetical protein